MTISSENTPYPVENPMPEPEQTSLQGQVLFSRLHSRIAFFQVGIPGVEERQVAIPRTPNEDGTYSDDLVNIKIGDVVSATGTLGETETSKRRGLGQISLFADKLTVNADNQAPRWPGEHTMAQLDRQADHTTALLERHASRRAIRTMLDSQGYVELETSILQQNPSGAAARTFSTVANFNNATYHLRIAPEIDLKYEMARTGLPRVYEIGRNFRNEGISPTHHPEFTNMEMYTVGDDQDTSIATARKLLATTAEAFNVTEPVDFDRAPILDYGDLFKRHLGIDLDKLSKLGNDEQAAYLRTYMVRNNIIDPAVTDLHTTGMLDLMFKKVVRPTLIGASIVTGYLSRQMPLAAARADNPNIVDGFQVIVHTQEVVKAYNELTDPELLQKNLAAQAGEAEEDATPTDPRLIEAARMGLPQMYGIGLGLDRFHALMTGRRIEDVIPVSIK
ncbi:MAG: lysyl-tRNA synthetase [Candidatus Saccharibacteria bacterium]|nr:lysyl-tRNA synthetase [Candidatus Saccharibacteria bacterium]